MVNVPIHTAFLNSINELDSLRELAVFIKLKQLYRNSCIYNATYPEISRKSGISISVLKQCLPFFKVAGWVREHGKNLVFEKMTNIDTSEIKKRTLIPLKILKNDGYKQILKRLKLLIVRVCKERFDFIKKLSTDRNNPDYLPFKERKRALKKAIAAEKNGMLRKLISATEEFKISNQKIGSMLKISQSSASRLMKWGVKNKIVKIKTNLIEIGRNMKVFSVIGSSGKTNFFLSKQGVILKQGANYVTFI